MLSICVTAGGKTLGDAAASKNVIDFPYGNDVFSGRGILNYFPTTGKEDVPEGLFNVVFAGIGVTASITPVGIADL